MVQLKDFVTNVLVDIVEGVVAAQLAPSANGAVVSPDMGNESYSGWKGAGRDRHGRHVQLVEFDVAVTATETSGASGKVGVLAAVAGVGGGLESSSSNTTASRIKFVVPVLLPSK